MRADALEVKAGAIVSTKAGREVTVLAACLIVGPAGLYAPIDAQQEFLVGAADDEPAIVAGGGCWRAEGLPELLFRQKLAHLRPQGFRAGSCKVLRSGLFEGGFKRSDALLLDCQALFELGDTWLRGIILRQLGKADPSGQNQQFRRNYNRACGPRHARDRERRRPAPQGPYRRGQPYFPVCSAHPAGGLIGQPPTGGHTGGPSQGNPGSRLRRSRRGTPAIRSTDRRWPRRRPESRTRHPSREETGPRRTVPYARSSPVHRRISPRAAALRGSGLRGGVDHRGVPPGAHAPFRRG